MPEHYRQTPISTAMNDDDHAPTLWSFTLVGMKYNGVTARDCEQYDKLVLMSDPDNAVDPNAIKVLGGDDGRMLGHVSMDSQPRAALRIPENGTSGTVYRVYASNARGAAAVEITLHLSRTEPYKNIT